MAKTTGGRREENRRHILRPASGELGGGLAEFFAEVGVGFFAARDADEGGLADGGRFSIAAAKCQASDFAQRIAAIGHQSMGAMGA